MHETVTGRRTRFVSAAGRRAHGGPQNSRALESEAGNRRLAFGGRERRPVCLKSGDLSEASALLRVPRSIEVIHPAVHVAVQAALPEKLGTGVPLPGVVELNVF